MKRRTNGEVPGEPRRKWPEGSSCRYSENQTSCSTSSCRMASANHSCGDPCRKSYCRSRHSHLLVQLPVLPLHREFSFSELSQLDLHFWQAPLKTTRYSRMTPRAQRGRLRAAWKVEPVDVLHAAAVADEVMVTMNFGVEAGGRAFEDHFAHQVRLDQRVQAVVHRGAGVSRVGPVEGAMNLVGGGVHEMADEKLHHSVPLGAKRLLDLGPRFLHRQVFRLCLRLDVVN